jgi:hypothetical protein
MMTEKSIEYWEYFIGETQRSGAPLYTKIIQGVAQDEDMKSLAYTARGGQPPANILLGAVHYLLLKGATDPLRRFYPNLNGGKQIEGEDPYPCFKAFVESHRAELAPLIASRVTNTNEVGRSAFLHLGFRAVARAARTPLHVVEIGPSAGFNQLWDRYGVKLRRGEETTYLGAADATLVLGVELQGENLPPFGPTSLVASRLGIELNPVDLDDPDVCDWLRALVWPDQVGRFAQLEAALQLTRQHRPSLLKGDALDVLPDVVGRLPENDTVCVYHTLVTYQFL